MKSTRRLNSSYRRWDMISRGKLVFPSARTLPSTERNQDGGNEANKKHLLYPIACRWILWRWTTSRTTLSSPRQTANFFIFTFIKIRRHGTKLLIYAKFNWITVFVMLSAPPLFSRTIKFRNKATFNVWCIAECIIVFHGR